MGSIEKRGKGSWRVGFQVETPSGWKWVRETIRVDPSLSESKQRKKAEKALARLQDEVDAVERGPHGYYYTLRSWSEVWMEKEIKPNCSPVTYAGYRYLLDSRILPQLGEMGLPQLTPVLLTDWLAQLRAAPRKSTRLPDEQLSRRRSPSWQLHDEDQDKPLSVKTLQNYYTCMFSMLAAAVRLDVLASNPMEKVRRPAERKKGPASSRKNRPWSYCAA